MADFIQGSLFLNDQLHFDVFMIHLLNGPFSGWKENVDLGSVLEYSKQLQVLLS